jgi:serine/threonine-protein kinase
MAVVYKARQTDLNRLVALKMMVGTPRETAEHLARFRAEAQAAAGLNHPNVVQTHEVGQHNGIPYLAMEFVAGDSLDQKMHRGPQPPREAAALIETLARAIHYAHEHGVIHRDLKPANILLSADGVPKIVDFGLVRQSEEAPGQIHGRPIVGTPSYMAPEQARGDLSGVGPATDIYALGAVLYELLTGRAPFLAATQLDTVMQVLTHEPVPPSKLQPQVPRDLETICLTCLAKKPMTRYASALALAEDLRRFLDGHPIRARRPSHWQKIAQWSRRHPAQAALIVVASLAIILILVMLLWAIHW